MTSEGKLTPEIANQLYVDGHSPCEIAQMYGRGRTAAGVRRMISRGGLVWCLIHRTYEEKAVGNDVF